MAKQDYKFEVVLYLYTDSYNCSEVLDRIISYAQEYLYIKHDMDLNDDGTLKKIHYHVYFKINNPLTVQGVAYDLGIPVNMIQYVRNWRSAIRYAFHLDNPNKHQYKFDEASSNFQYTSFLGLSDQAVAKELNAYIQERCPTIDQFVSFCLEYGYWSSCRRGWAIWCQLIKIYQERRVLLNDHYWSTGSQFHEQ